MINILQIESFKISKCKILKILNSKTIVKICENDFISTILNSRTKVKKKRFYIPLEKSYNKTVIGLNFGRHKALSTLKVIFTSALRSRLKPNSLQSESS